MLQKSLGERRGRRKEKQNEPPRISISTRASSTDAETATAWGSAWPCARTTGRPVEHTTLDFPYCSREGRGGLHQWHGFPGESPLCFRTHPHFSSPLQKIPQAQCSVTTQCSTIYFALAKTSNFNFKNYFYCTPSRKNVICSYTKTINTISVPSTSSPSLSNTVPLRLLNPNSWRQHLGSRLSLASA